MKPSLPSQLIPNAVLYRVKSDPIRIIALPSVSNRFYGVYSKTNLTDSGWSESATVTNNSGSIDSYIVTNDMPSAFFKIDISLP